MCVIFREEDARQRGALHFFPCYLRASVCAELGYDFYNDIYAEYVDVVSFTTPKWLGAAGVRAAVGGLCALSALYYTLTCRNSGICCILSQFSVGLGLNSHLVNLLRTRMFPSIMFALYAWLLWPGCVRLGSLSF